MKKQLKTMNELNIPRMKAHIKVVSKEKKGFWAFRKETNSSWYIQRVVRLLLWLCGEIV